MAVVTPEQKIEKACVNAKEKLESLGIEDKIQAELEYVIGSYGYDKNPIGLYEIGGKAFKALESYKSEFPRKVSKKLLSDIEGALKLTQFVEEIKEGVSEQLSPFFTTDLQV